MNSIILCEGSTDYVLLQYFMRVANGWQEDREKQQHLFKFDKQSSRKFFKDNSSLTIAAVGGSSRIIEGLRDAILRNSLVSPVSDDDFFDKIVILTDRDEINTESELIEKIEDIFNINQVVACDTLKHNTWIKCTMQSRVGMQREFEILIIPFEDCGAMETFLLEAIAQNDEYDGSIINQCNNMIDTIDPKRKYLNKRRIITKAKFDTYFSIRTSATQFVERQNILKSVRWEMYEKIQEKFILLKDLSE